MAIRHEPAFEFVEAVVGEPADQVEEHLGGEDLLPHHPQPVRPLPPTGPRDGLGEDPSSGASRARRLAGWPVGPLTQPENGLRWRSLR